MRRWTCPTCGSGALAPERPRRDDVRRYCLVCSKRTGRLVERQALAAEKAREEKAERMAARVTRARDREKADALASRSIHGVDLMAEARRLWALPTLRELHRGWRLPTITLRQSPNKWHSSGRGGSGRVTMTVGMLAGTEAGAVEVLLHELMHNAVGRVDGQWHSPKFWSHLRSAAKEAWPEVPFDFASAPQRGYDVDHWITGRLQRFLQENPRPGVD